MGHKRGMSLQGDRGVTLTLTPTLINPLYTVLGKDDLSFQNLCARALNAAAIRVSVKDRGRDRVAETITVTDRDE